MNRLSIALAVMAVTVASLLALAPALAAARSGLTMNVAFNPSPPRQGNETITITVHDAHNKPISNAKVTIATSMPSMSMGGPTIKASPLRAGVYVARLNLNFATQWVFNIKATSGHESVHGSVTENVK